MEIQHLSRCPRERVPFALKEKLTKSNFDYPNTDTRRSASEALGLMMLALQGEPGFPWHTFHTHRTCLIQRKPAYVTPLHYIKQLRSGSSGVKKEGGIRYSHRMIHSDVTHTHIYRHIKNDAAIHHETT